MTSLHKSVGGRPRVLMLLSNGFDPDPRVHNEARTLVENGYSVRIVAWDRDRARPEEELVDGIEVRRVYLKSTHGRGWTQMLFMPLVFLRMIRIALQGRFDIIHAHDFDTLPPALFLSWLRRTPVVYDAHEDYAGMLHGSLPGWLLRLIRWSETRMVRRVDLVVTVGEILRQEFARRGCKVVRVLGNWKSRKAFQLPHDVRIDVRRRLGIPPEALMVLYISNLGRERHVEELLQAIKQRPHLYLLVGGTGPTAALVAEHAEKYPNIFYLGFVQQSDVPRYTSACDLVYYGFDVNSPNAKYSAPNKLFEALAAGRPLLTANFGEIGAIVTANQCGIILKDYSVAEILRGLDTCSDSSLLCQLKAAAHQAGGNEYSWEHGEQVLLEAYQELIPECGCERRETAREVVAR